MFSGNSNDLPPKRQNIVPKSSSKEIGLFAFSEIGKELEILAREIDAGTNDDWGKVAQFHCSLKNDFPAAKAALLACT